MSSPADDKQHDKYDVDERGFLRDPHHWDEAFATATASEVGLAEGLTGEHWNVINSIRQIWASSGRCPSVYETCRLCGLRLKDLKRLFPTGYLRGACRLAGITFVHGYVSQSALPQTAEDLNVIAANKTYTVDVRGFLVDSNQWDEYYAVFRAHDMKIPGGRLSENHWRVIRFLREYFHENQEVPPVYDACRALDIDLGELERLFPDGYHRGAVKMAGLRVL